MATARNYTTLQNLVATICQDLSTNGLAQAGIGINTIIKELTREFKMPQMFKGWDKSVFLTPSVTTGVQTLSLNSDVVKIESVWWVDDAQTNWQLDQITSDEDWLTQTDNYQSDEPLVYRYFQPANVSYAVPQIQIFPGATAAWIAQSGGNLYYSYWAQLVQLVNPTDIPNLPYELDTTLVNGGVTEMARQQGDNVLIKMYKEKYEDDKGEIRAWIIKQRTQDGQMRPDNPQGVWGTNTGFTGYRIA
jgi:hypothetical protein